MDHKGREVEPRDGQLRNSSRAGNGKRSMGWSCAVGVSCSVTARHWASIKQPARSCTPPGRGLRPGSIRGPGLARRILIGCGRRVPGFHCRPTSTTASTGSRRKILQPNPATLLQRAVGSGDEVVFGWGDGQSGQSRRWEQHRSSTDARRHLTFGRSPMPGFLPVSLLSKTRHPEHRDSPHPTLGFVLHSVSRFLKCSAPACQDPDFRGVESSRVKSSRVATYHSTQLLDNRTLSHGHREPLYLH